MYKGYHPGDPDKAFNKFLFGVVGLSAIGLLLLLGGCSTGETVVFDKPLTQAETHSTAPLQEVCTTITVAKLREVTDFSNVDVLEGKRAKDMATQLGAPPGVVAKLSHLVLMGDDEVDYVRVIFFAGGCAFDLADIPRDAKPKSKSL